MSRLYYLTAKNNNKFTNKITCSSSYFVSNHRFSSFPSPQTIPSPPLASKKKFSLLKFGIFSAFLGTAATAGYATYTYTVDQVDELTKGFRQLVTMITVENDVSSLKDLADPISDKLLPNLDPLEQKFGLKTIVLDLNETLICCNWKRERGWKIFKRPGLEVFLDTISNFFEVVIYTDMMAEDISQIIHQLNHGGAICHVLSRSGTKYHNGKYYRDLSKLNRDPSRVIYISGHALENALQQENCAPIKPWKLEEGDTTLTDLLPFLEFVARQGSVCPDLRQILQSYKGADISTEFAKRQREMLEKPKKKSARLEG